MLISFWSWLTIPAMLSLSRSFFPQSHLPLVLLHLDWWLHCPQCAWTKVSSWQYIGPFGRQAAGWNSDCVSSFCQSYSRWGSFIFLCLFHFFFCFVPHHISRFSFVAVHGTNFHSGTGSMHFFVENVFDYVCACVLVRAHVCVCVCVLISACSASGCGNARPWHWSGP